VRHAVQEGATLIVIHPRRTGLDDRAHHKLSYRPGAGADLLIALKGGEHPEVTAALSQGPIVALVGRSGITEDRRLAEAVAAFARTLPQAKVLPLVRRANTYGALDMGLAPSLLPGRVAAGSADFEGDWGALPAPTGRETSSILKSLESGAISGLLLVGADPVRDVPDGSLARQALETAEFIVAIDTFLTDSSRLADIVLPAEGFAEKEGTVTNLEGRVQKVNRVVPGPGQSRPDWSILDDLSNLMGKPLNLASAEAISKEIASVAAAYQGVTWDVLEWEGLEGVVVPLPEARQPLFFIPADAPGKSAAGEIVLHYARTLFDDGVMLRYSPSLVALAPGAAAYLHPDDARLMTVREGDDVEVETEVGAVTLSVRLDASLGHGVVYIPFNQPGVPSLGSDPRVTVKKVGS